MTKECHIITESAKKAGLSGPSRLTVSEVRYGISVIRKRSVVKRASKRKESTG